MWGKDARVGVPPEQYYHKERATTPLTHSIFAGGASHEVVDLGGRQREKRAWGANFTPTNLPHAKYLSGGIPGGGGVGVVPPNLPHLAFVHQRIGFLLRGRGNKNLPLISLRVIQLQDLQTETLPLTPPLQPTECELTLPLPQPTSTSTSTVY